MSDLRIHKGESCRHIWGEGCGFADDYDIIAAARSLPGAIEHTIYAGQVISVYVPGPGSYVVVPIPAQIPEVPT